MPRLELAVGRATAPLTITYIALWFAELRVFARLLLPNFAGKMV
jgi:hypothetical protein